MPFIAFWKLYVTEIFYDWTDEWIEVYNSGDVFNWNVSIKGIKSKNLDINLSLWTDEYIIIWDDLTNIVWSWNYMKWMWLSITDTKWIDVSLIVSWSVIDNFLINSDDVLFYNNKNNSFERIFSDKSEVFTATTNTRIFNVTWSRIANPSKIHIESIEQTNIDDNSACNSWYNDNLIMDLENLICKDNLWEEVLYNVLDLQFLEVFPKSDDQYPEYVVIRANTDFNWIVDIVWLWYWDATKSVELTMLSWDVVYLVWKDIWLIDNQNMIYIEWLNLANDWENIGMLTNWQSLDEIVYSSIDESKSLIYSYIENWIRYFSNKQIPSLKVFSLEQIDPDQKDFDQQVACYENLVETENGKIIISEIYPFDDYFNEYIEVYALWTYSWTVLIDWLWHWSYAKEVAINLLSWNYLVISDWLSWFVNNQNLVLIDSVSLTDAGELLTIFWQSGLVLDKVNYNNVHRWKSLYLSRYVLDNRFLDTYWFPSPWFDEKMLSYYEISDKKERYDCDIIIQNDFEFYDWNSINLMATVNWTELSNSQTLFKCEWTVITWDDSQKCNPSYFIFKSWWINDIQVDIYKENELVCTDSMQINYPQKSIIKNWKEWYYKNLYTTWKNKYYELVDSLKLSGLSISKDGQIRSKKINDDNNFQLNQWILKIFSITPNPVWKDDFKEAIQIILLSWDSFSLQGMELKYGNIHKQLKWAINSGTGFVMYDNFRFPNDWSCVYLVSWSVQYDKFCYLKQEEGSPIFEPIQLEDNVLSILSKTKINIGESSVCISYEKQNMFCGQLKIWKMDLDLLNSENKQLKKENKSLNNNILKLIKSNNKEIDKIKKNFEKKLIKTEKKVNKMDQKISKKDVDVKNLKGRIKQLSWKLSQKNKDLIDYKHQCALQTKHIKQANKDRQSKMLLEIWFHKNYISFVKNRLKNDRYQVYNSSIKDIDLVYDDLYSDLKSWNYYHDIRWFPINIKDIDLIYKIKNNGMPISFIWKIVVYSSYNKILNILADNKLGEIEEWEGSSNLDFDKKTDVLIP